MAFPEPLAAEYSNSPSVYRKTDQVVLNYLYNTNNLSEIVNPVYLVNPLYAIIENLKIEQTITSDYYY